jgi:hypothetical protein
MRLVACATAGPRGSPHVDAVESHQLYLPGVPPGPLRCAAARPYECGTNGRLANPAKRTESIILYYDFNLDILLIRLFLLFPRSAGTIKCPVQLTMFSSSLPRRMAPATRQWVVSTTIQHLGALMVRHQTEAHTKDTPRSLAKKLRFLSDGNLKKYFFWREGERESKWSY